MGSKWQTASCSQYCIYSLNVRQDVTSYSFKCSSTLSESLLYVLVDSCKLAPRVSRNVSTKWRLDSFKYSPLTTFLIRNGNSYTNNEVIHKKPVHTFPSLLNLTLYVQYKTIYGSATMREWIWPASVEITRHVKQSNKTIGHKCKVVYN